MKKPATVLTKNSEPLEHWSFQEHSHEYLEDKTALF